jgi:hypothetical protein
VLYVLFKTGLVAICYKGVNKLEQQRPSLCRRESDLQWDVWMQCLHGDYICLNARDRFMHIFLMIN